MAGENRKLVKHPFKVKNKADVLLYSAGDSFEYHFDDTVHSPSITAEKSKTTKHFIECEIQEDGSVKMIAEYDSVYVFKKPADFHLPQENAEFYTNFHKILLDSDLNNFEKHAEELNEYLRSNNFPEYNQNDLTRTKVTDHQHFLEPKPKDDYVKVVSIAIEDEIPNSHPNDFRKRLTIQFGKAKYNEITEFIQTHMQDDVFTIADLQKYYDRLKTPTFKLYQLKQAINEHFFMYSSGPWKCCRVRFGYDPKRDWSNYKYQKVESRSKNMNFVVKDNPVLLKKIEENRSWYLSETFDIKMGFLTREFMKFANYVQTNHIEELVVEEEYEIFD